MQNVQPHSLDGGLAAPDEAGGDHRLGAVLHTYADNNRHTQRGELQSLQIGTIQEWPPDSYCSSDYDGCSGPSGSYEADALSAAGDLEVLHEDMSRSRSARVVSQHFLPPTAIAGTVSEVHVTKQLLHRPSFGYSETDPCDVWLGSAVDHALENTAVGDVVSSGEKTDATHGGEMPLGPQVIVSFAGHVRSGTDAKFVTSDSCGSNIDAKPSTCPPLLGPLPSAWASQRSHTVTAVSVPVVLDPHASDTDERTALASGNTSVRTVTDAGAEGALDTSNSTAAPVVQDASCSRQMPGPAICAAAGMRGVVPLRRANSSIGTSHTSWPREHAVSLSQTLPSSPSRLQGICSNSRVCIHPLRVQGGQCGQPSQPGRTLSPAISSGVLSPVWPRVSRSSSVPQSSFVQVGTPALPQQSPCRAAVVRGASSPPLRTAHVLPPPSRLQGSTCRSSPHEHRLMALIDERISEALAKFEAKLEMRLRAHGVAQMQSSELKGSDAGGSKAANDAAITSLNGLVDHLTSTVASQSSQIQLLEKRITEFLETSQSGFAACHVELQRSEARIQQWACEKFGALKDVRSQSALDVKSFQTGVLSSLDHVKSIKVSELDDFVNTSTSAGELDSDVTVASCDVDIRSGTVSVHQKLAEGHSSHDSCAVGHGASGHSSERHWRGPTASACFSFQEHSTYVNTSLGVLAVPVVPSR